MVARVSRTFIKQAKGKGLIVAETKPRSIPRGSVGWPAMHLDNGKKGGRFPVAAKSARTIDGVVFDSKGESIRYTQLRLLQRAGKIRDLELQPSWDVMINGQRLCRYTCDFSYYCNERQTPVLEEVKSGGTAKDASYRLRRKAAELTFGIRITEVLL